MFEVLEELDRLLCSARTRSDQAPNGASLNGGGVDQVPKVHPDPTRRARLQIHQQVIAALKSETASVESFVARAELALFVSVDDNDPQTRLLDLLCLLRHWGDANGADFEAALNEAESHYQVERIDPHEIEAPSSSVKWRCEAVEEPTEDRSRFEVLGQ